MHPIEKYQSKEKGIFPIKERKTFQVVKRNDFNLAGLLMGDDISLCMLSIADWYDFCSTNVVQLSNRNLYFYWFQCHHPLINQLNSNQNIPIIDKGNIQSEILNWGMTQKKNDELKINLQDCESELVIKKKKEKSYLY